MVWDAPYPERLKIFNYATIDHVRRLADGGKNSLENCVFACRKCNNDRHRGDQLRVKGLRNEDKLRRLHRVARMTNYELRHHCGNLSEHELKTIRAMLHHVVEGSELAAAFAERVDFPTPPAPPPPD
jgi:hypothetical protein